ncbi:MAG: class I SAM-dependent methyltransferase, partial [Myxococcota bacterium]
PTEAWRAYDRDMPAYPWTVDVYGEAVVLQEFRNSGVDDAVAEEHARHVFEGVVEVFDPPEDLVVLKERRRQKGDAQYEKLSQQSQELVVTEGELKFWVNLTDYIDTGLFNDHRNLRRMVHDELAAREHPRLLNLFAYTGTFSVWGAKAGAHTTTADLSNTYLEWAQRNFELNGLDLSAHLFERTDVTRWMQQVRGRIEAFDVVVLDPPTFSRSKKMERDLDLQRDHRRLIEDAMDLLCPGGVLYFSTNFRGFRLDPELFSSKSVEEITRRTVPEDYRAGIHRAWRIRR